MKIRPLQDRVLVKRVESEEKTKGGIIIPDTAKEKPIEGKVVAVGAGKVGDDGKVRALDVKATALVEELIRFQLLAERSVLLASHDEGLVGRIAHARLQLAPLKPTGFSPP